MFNETCFVLLFFIMRYLFVDDDCESEIWFSLICRRLYGRSVRPADRRT